MEKCVSDYMGYIAPECKVLTISNSSVICGSLGQEGESGRAGGDGYLNGGFNDGEEY